MHRGSSFRLHGWICWSLIAGSWVAIAGATYDALAGFDEFAAKFDHPALEHPKPPLWLIAISSAVLVLFLAVGLSRRGRGWLRMHHRPSRPSAQGDIYLEAFTLSIVVTSLGMAGFQLVSWSLGMLGALVAILYAFARCRSIRVPLADWGWWGGRGAWLDISIGVLLGLMLTPLGYLPGLVFDTDASLVGGSVAIFSFLRAVAWAPIAEETLYRGMLYSYLRNRWRWPAAVLISAAVFASMHLPLPRMPHVFVFGIVFVLLREWRGSLLAPLATHATTNLMITLVRGY